MTKNIYLTVALAALLLVTGCGTTWVDDNDNFKRVFGFEPSPDIHVVHSYYWKAPFWSYDFRFYIAMRVPEKMVKEITPADLWKTAVSVNDSRNACGNRPPAWFVSKPASHYEMWVPADKTGFPKEYAGHVFFRDKDDNTMYYCSGRI